MIIKRCLIVILVFSSFVLSGCNYKVIDSIALENFNFSLLLLKNDSNFYVGTMDKTDDGTVKHRKKILLAPSSFNKYVTGIDLTFIDYSVEGDMIIVTVKYDYFYGKNKNIQSEEIILKIDDDGQIISSSRDSYSLDEMF